MDSVLKERLKSQKALPFKAKLAGFVAMCLVRGLGFTMRMKVDDPSGVLTKKAGEPMIWALWHNRIFALALVYKKLMPWVRGVVLTSPSKDGNYLAAFARALNVCAVRGSSSKKGGRALVEMTDWMKAGFVMGITPDGPRGPRYKLAPGLVKLSQLTGSPIVTHQIEYSRYWSVHKSWDRFRFPKPFATVSVTITLVDPVDPDLDDQEFEEIRAHIEYLLNPNNETD